jgi:hypothetical protein
VAKIPPRVPTKAAVLGGGSVAGQIFASNLDLSAIQDPKARLIVERQLAAILPVAAVKAGAAAPELTANPDDLQRLIPSAAVSAAGLDPARTSDPAPDVLWEDAGSALLVHVAKVRANLGDGFVDIVVPVACDQSQDTEITVTFVGGSRDQPAGGIITTEDHPRGASVVVEQWHEALIAFAWSTLINATSALSGAVGLDAAGRPLVSAALTLTPDGLAVLPMGRHAFVRGGVGP